MCIVASVASFVKRKFMRTSVVAMSLMRTHLEIGYCVRFSLVYLHGVMRIVASVAFFVKKKYMRTSVFAVSMKPVKL